MEIKRGGVVSQLLAGVPIPRMFRAERPTGGLTAQPKEQKNRLFHPKKAVF